MHGCRERSTNLVTVAAVVGIVKVFGHSNNHTAVGVGLATISEARIEPSSLNEDASQRCSEQ